MSSTDQQRQSKVAAATGNIRDDTNTQLSDSAEAFIVHTDQIYYLAVLYTDENWRSFGSGYAQFANGQKMTFTMDGNNDPKVREKCVQASRQIAHAYQGTLEQGIVDSTGQFWPSNDGNSPQNLM